MTPAARRVPGVVLRRPAGSPRPQGVTSVYGYSQREFARLTRARTLHRVTNGYYAVVSDDQIDEPEVTEPATENAVTDELD
ncbi:MAG TPA: hypothetical protein VG756_26220 [Pseudonocardiaceae bacterium]|jgi:hypothetical protein|nr:hypothetical protein [Pseudonocardiaceae bacterium]